jgi:hypothetical protein
MLCQHEIRLLVFQGPELSSEVSRERERGVGRDMGQGVWRSVKIVWADFP